MRSARALAEAVERAKRRKLGRFTDVQTAIKRVTHEPGPVQNLRPSGEEVPAQAGPSKLRSGGALHTKGFPVVRSRTGGPEPDDHGVEWLAHAGKYGRRSMPITAFLGVPEAQGLGKK